MVERISTRLVCIDSVMDIAPVASTLNNLVDIVMKCFLSLRQCCTKIELTNKYFKHLNDKSYIRCIVLLIPIIGNLTVWLHDRKKSTTPAANDLANPQNLPSASTEPVASHSMVNVGTLEESHKLLEAQASTIKREMMSKDIWGNPEFIKKVSVFMEDAFQEIEIYYTDLTAKSGGDKKKMAQMMMNQRPPEGKTNYCFCFFYNSINEMYRLARGCVQIQNGHGKFKVLEKQDIQPYFTKSTPQYRWRELYNAACKKFEDTGLTKSTLVPSFDPAYAENPDYAQSFDRRFVDWSKPDNDPKMERYYFPMRPT